jgi:hypothetical protein
MKGYSGTFPLGEHMLAALAQEWQEADPLEDTW